jgi:hypothetical protein
MLSSAIVNGEGCYDFTAPTSEIASWRIDFHRMKQTNDSETGS